ncbi:hypothetical protein HDU97_001858 [Phlyctochytrium planicorne]|nr:hypothetical protein HDU97_001858 [Phlyctochytrium planicorne]
MSLFGSSLFPAGMAAEQEQQPEQQQPAPEQQQQQQQGQQDQSQAVSSSQQLPQLPAFQSLQQLAQTPAPPGILTDFYQPFQQGSAAQSQPLPPTQWVQEAAKQVAPPPPPSSSSSNANPMGAQQPIQQPVRESMILQSSGGNFLVAANSGRNALPISYVATRSPEPEPEPPSEPSRDLAAAPGTIAATASSESVTTLGEITASPAATPAAKEKQLESLNVDRQLPKDVEKQELLNIRSRRLTPDVFVVLGCIGFVTLLTLIGMGIALAVQNSTAKDKRWYYNNMNPDGTWLVSIGFT